MVNFHTIKSILNVDMKLWSFLILIYFHTIKSILNNEWDMQFHEGDVDFHTIKSILNSIYYYFNFHNITISILLSLF